MPSVSLSRRTKIALSVVGILIVLLVTVVKLSGTYVDYLWFDEVGASGVFTTVLWTRVVLFLIFGVLMAAIIGGNIAAAYLIKPPFRPMSPEQQNLQNYVLMVEPRRKLILIGVALVAFLAAGASAQGDWAAWQLWLNGQSFGATDPQFGIDISFYAWDYPVYRLLLGFGFTAVIFSLILCIGIHYLTGAIRLQTPGPKITVAARRHLTILVFVFMLLKAVAYWLDRYGLVFSTRGERFTGASYTDVHSALPAKTILFWITIVLALGVLASLWLRSSLLPGIGFVVLLILSILMGGVYPAIVQGVTVNPNASDKERPYISRNIEATRAAYGIVTKSGATDKKLDSSAGTVTYRPFDADTNPDPAALKSTDPSVANLRILDPNVVSPTFARQQAQQPSGVFGFPSKLDVDRYTVNGTPSDYIVGVRELSAAQLSGSQTNWINQYTNFTHGYGFVAAEATTVTTSTNYADGYIPQRGPLNSAVPLKKPQVYYGELMPSYSIVGAKGEPREFDGDGNAKVTYDGKGGIPLDSIFTRAAFALDETETNFLLNDAVSADGARAIINRDPRERVKKIAPFLTVDGDPYPFVDSSSGHIMWMVDAYTTMANYPYSERRSLSDLTDDSLTRTNKNPGQADTEVNYIRNSVKATVDAYDGTVKLYRWDDKDPVLKTWESVFPGLISPSSEMPESVREHIRYPEDLFEVQRGLLEQYHVDSPVTFYNQSDQWTIPLDPAAEAGDQPPYYVLADAQNAGSSGAQFQLTTPMRVNGKDSLAAYITVSSDPDSYGQMTILRAPTDNPINGPRQVANDFQNDQQINEFRTNVSRGGSQVIRGNMLTLPVGKGFLYAQPLYVQAEGGGGFPLLQRVQVSYGNGNVGFGTDVASALQDLRTGSQGGGTGTQTPPGGGGSSTAPPSSSSGSSGSSSGSSSSGTGNPSTSVDTLATQLQRAQAELAAAYASGDQDRIAAAIAAREKIVAEIVAARSSETASPSSRSSSPPSSPSSSR